MSPVPPSQAASTSRVPELRPMRVGELLDTAIKLYRENWRIFMGIVAFVVVPFTFIEQYTYFTASRSGTLDETADVTVFLVLTGVSFLIVQPFLAAAILRAASGVYLREQVSIGDAYAFALPRIFSILWVTILTALAVIGGFFLLIIPAFLFYIRFLFAPSVIIMETHRGTKAMGRSWRLAKGFFWKLFGTILLTGILTAIVGAILTVPANIIALRSEGSSWFVLAIGSSLAEIIVAPVMAIVVVLLYFDMRIRKEGFDLTLMARELSQQPGVE